MVEARALTSKSRSSADKLLTSDNPIFAKNFKALLQKTMQDGGDTWEALKDLRTLKEEVPGFDFRIQYDPKGRPTAICWMLPHMHTNLLRYGDVLFLDTMMKRVQCFGLALHGSHCQGWRNEDLTGCQMHCHRGKIGNISFCCAIHG
jgi:hypothetical protein